VSTVELAPVSRWFGNVVAVNDVTMRLTPGVTGLLGPNGAGKSTLNELILGLVSPDAGRVAVFGTDPRTAVQCGRVGAMLQGGALLDQVTVHDLLRLMHGLYPRPLPLPEIINRADLGSFLATRTDKLSGGQAQRLRYALAIMPDPALLILDEPTVAMDVEVRRAFWTSMRDFVVGGRTVLFATHYLDEADAEAMRIVVLAEGRIVADGSGAEIKSRVAGRTLGMAADSVDAAAVARLPGALRVEPAGARLLVHAVDSDAALRALLRDCPDARDIEVTSAKLEDAFLALTQTLSVPAGTSKE